MPLSTVRTQLEASLILNSCSRTMSLEGWPIAPSPVIAGKGTKEGEREGIAASAGACLLPSFHNGGRVGTAGNRHALSPGRQGEQVWWSTLDLQPR